VLRIFNQNGIVGGELNQAKSPQSLDAIPNVADLAKEGSPILFYEKKKPGSSMAPITFSAMERRHQVIKPFYAEIPDNAWKNAHPPRPSKF